MSDPYGKLVRDKIPEIIESNGEKPITRVLDEEEYKQMLDEKLLEEVNEYLESNNKEELGDIIEVIRGICKNLGITFEEVMNVADEKRIKRGGFNNKIFLVGVEKEKN